MLAEDNSDACVTPSSSVIYSFFVLSFPFLRAFQSPRGRHRVQPSVLCICHRGDEHNKVTLSLPSKGVRHAKFVSSSRRNFFRASFLILVHLHSALIKVCEAQLKVSVQKSLFSCLGQYGNAALLWAPEMFWLKVILSWVLNCDIWIDVL